MRDHSEDVNLINGVTGESFTNERILRGAVARARVLLAAREARGRRGQGASDVTGAELMCVMRNREDLIMLYYGALFAGVKIFLLDPQSTQLELNHFLALVEPSVVACDADRLDDVRAAVQAYGKIPVDAVLGHDSLERCASGHDSDPSGFEPAVVSPESCAVLLPTSGSTGLPKAAVITHAGLLAQLPSLWVSHTQFPRPTERLMFMSTAQWMTFTNFLTTCPVYRITMIVTPDKTLPTVIRIIETYKATWLVLVPGTAALLADEARAEQLTSLRTLAITGAAATPAVLCRLAALLPQAAVFNSYGMTEASGFASIADKQAPMSSIGKIFNIFQYKLVDDDGNVVPRGTKGELYLKANCIIKSYLKNVEAYQECATPDGWWRTGDVFTEDDQNYLFFVERKKFWFKYLNYHISPEELEKVISGVEGVQEVVVGESERGAAAAVVRRPGASVSPEDVHKAVNSALIEYKRLRGGVAFVTSLPRTHSGKLHRADCTRLLARLVDCGECC